MDKKKLGEGKAALTDIVSIKVACYGSTLHIFTSGMLLALSKLDRAKVVHVIIFTLVLMR
jgi:hypothetical protein